MNRLDPVSGQLVAPTPSSGWAVALRLTTWGVFAVALIGSVSWGMQAESNPLDQVAILVEW